MAGKLANALAGYLNRSTPGYLIFFVTPFCPCKCKMCFNRRVIDNAASRNVLTLDEISRFSKNFPGLHQINFSGGEPLMRSDFPEVMREFYANSGTRFFTIPTSSAQPAMYEAAVRKCLDYCPDAWIRITQSVDAVGPLHDEIRQRPGLFEAVADFNARLHRLTAQHPNLSVGMATVFSKFNSAQSYDLLDYVYAHFKFTDFAALYVRGETAEKDAKNVDALEFAKFQTECIRCRRGRSGRRRSFSDRAFSAVNLTVCQYVMRAAVEGRYIMPCHATRRMVVMDDEGNVEPCEVLASMIRDGVVSIETARLGNIRDFNYDIRRLLATPTARGVARQIVQKRCHCTFECAMAVNTIYNFRAWPRVLKNFLGL